MCSATRCSAVSSTHLDIAQFKLKVIDFGAIARIQCLTDNKYGFDVLNGELGIASSRYHSFAG